MGASSTVERLQNEADFHDRRFENDDARAPARRFYQAVSISSNDYRDKVLDAVDGQRFLEYGCGRGGLAFAAAEAGADVTAIDISSVAIEEARSAAAETGLTNRISFHEMNAEALDFEHASFDRVCGSGILHHLDLSRAVLEVHRVLDAGGRAVFLEPLGHNPLINWYRKRTPEMRTEDEHPLLTSDLDMLAEHFIVDAEYFGLAEIGSAFVRSVPLVGGLLARALAAIDRVALRIPLLQKFAWIVVLELRPKLGSE